MKTYILLFILLILLGCSKDNGINGGYVEYFVLCHNCTGFYFDKKGNDILFYIDGKASSSYYVGRFLPGQMARIKITSNYTGSEVRMKIILNEKTIKEGGVNHWSDLQASQKLELRARIP